VTTAAARATRPPTEAELEKAKAEAQARAEADRAAKPVSTDDQISAWVRDAPPMEGPLGFEQGPALDVNGYPLDKDGKRQVHGEVGVSIGTGGYRSGYVSA
jgi:formylglycine-generating enzyme required for sulfatase activity